MRAYDRHIRYIMIVTGIVGMSVAAMGQRRASRHIIHPDQLSPTRLETILQDTIVADTIDTIAEMKIKQNLDHIIPYSSKDSMVVMKNGTALLYGDGDVKMDQMELKSDFIRVNTDSNTVFAHGTYDSIQGEWKGQPVIVDGKDSYNAKEITYNLSTRKGYLRHIVTEQGEGYVIAERAKTVDDNVLMMADGKYTTCNDHDHPHFYLNMTKAKVKPGDYIATGPAYMVVGDVPLPLAVPFGFFPFTNTYSSGLIMPNFGDDRTRGLYLQGIGYYFALSDYCDLEVTGDIYSRGTWAINSTFRYVKRYAFNGNINIAYRNDVTGEKNMPDYAVSKNFSIRWTHAQDSKANPYCNFSANVNFSTSGYNRSNINSYYNPALYSENVKSSSISYTQRFPNSPWTISMSASINQQTKDSTMSLTLPQLSVNMSRIYPFKRKKPVGKEKWYEKISMSYSGEGRIAINNFKEKEILHSNFLRDWQVGMKHSVPISASFMLFKYISVSPSISMTDRMYFQRTDQSWNDQLQQLERDTSYGFYNVFDFNVSMSMSTKLYGFYTPSKKLFPNSKVEKFRHVLTPSLSFGYHPDFGAQGWGYYGSYDQPVYTGEVDETGRKIQKVDELGNPVYVHQTYSRFSNTPYGTASQGASGTLSFSVDNNLEMKIVNKNDTTGEKPFRVVSLIDKLAISGAYNFIADSMNWSNFNVSMRIKIPKLNNYTLNLNTSFDPYMYQLNALGTPVRTNKQYWHNKQFPLFQGINWSISYTFNNELIKKWFTPKEKKKNENQNENQNGQTDEAFSVDHEGKGRNGKNRNQGQQEVENGYVKTKIPWSLTLSYSLRYGTAPLSKFNYEKMRPGYEFTQNLSISGNVSLGEGWKVSASTSYDFKYKKFTTATFNVSRDLHCWSMSASFVPFGPNKSYTFHIGVNASMLSDLKYDKSSYNSTNKRVTWW